MIGTAQRTLDLQYFIFRYDDTGQLIVNALLAAADRGVHVRVMIDDGQSVAGDEQIATLVAHPQIEVRVFNPFAYRGHSWLARGVEFMFHPGRLDYRMHNKLMVVDNAVALIGGRNIGNQYFQMDPESQFADADVFAAGPIARQLSATLDEYWNSPFAIPAKALEQQVELVSGFEAIRARAQLDSSPPPAPAKPGTVDYRARSATGEPYAGMISGRLPLVWTRAQVVCDSPDKKHVERGELGGRPVSLW